jgi:dephospho-CoA kinase
MAKRGGSPTGHRTKPVVGLVGGMGSGKSMVAAELARRGAAVISGDNLGHDGLRQPEIRDQVVQRWGSGVLNEQGEVDRRKVGAIVFADPAERQALEEMLFPWIEKNFETGIKTAEGDPAVKVIVLDAAIMLEAGWDHVCDRLVYIHAPRDVRLRRLAEQRGWTPKEVAARESAQMSLTAKVTRADDVVDNSGSAERLAQQIDHLLRHWEIIR